jgi:1-acyl-sn-glycerol-3-phosphate acyltransferase
MLSFLPPVVRGVLAALLLTVNTLFWCLPLFLLALVKLLLPFRAVRSLVDPALNALATSWIACNSGWMSLTQATRWDVAGLDQLEQGGWYMVSSNHQSWVDILVLQHVLNRRVPMLKFFLKRELLYVPVIGLAWWALDFPFMRRHSSAELRANPEKRFEDLETSRRACEKFALVPTSVMNFPEGTRFTAEKHAAQRSPYVHLLKPRAGAMALALSVLASRLRAFIDVTIVYPGGIPNFWDFLCGRVPEVVVRLRTLPIPPELAGGDYAADPRHRKRVQRWQQQQWREKDVEIEALLAARGLGSAGNFPADPLRSEQDRRKILLP